MTGIERIVLERQEQLEKHGITVEMDFVTNNKRQLVQAVRFITKSDGYVFTKYHNECPSGWDPEIWQKICKKGYKERLAIAGAFLAAEIDVVNIVERKMNEEQ